MKKCILMFAALIAVLLMAIFSEAKKNLKFEQQRLAIGTDVTENSMVIENRRDSVR